MLSRRGKIVLGSVGAVVALAAAAWGWVALTGRKVPIPVIGDIVKPPDPPECPLTGKEAGSEEQIARPAFAVKVENLSVARPQAGLKQADIVYEQPVEGGITRFIALYHCGGSKRIGPVRSARLVDPDVLRQYGRPIFAYAGGVERVFRAIGAAKLIDVNFVKAEPLYHKDPARFAPHNLFVSVSEFRDFTDEGEAPPEEGPFVFDEAVPDDGASTPAKRIKVNFSPAANVRWKFNQTKERWLRFHDSQRHQLEDGAVAVENVVVQIVRVRPGAILDAAGNPSPEIDVVGEGKAFVFRDGRVIEGTWSRPSKKDVTEFLDEAGDPIPLLPGQTWVELFPKNRPFGFS